MNSKTPSSARMRTFSRNIGRLPGFVTSITRRNHANLKPQTPALASQENNPVGAQRSKGCSFRGVVAPASLKLERFLLLVPDGLEFPGRCCPGLIEAGRYNEDSIMEKLGFRGVVAPASLKPLLLRQVSYDACNRFRGVVAPASLKPASPGLWRPRSASFPGRCCPGLIEA